MKILQVVPFFTPARGGSVIAPYHLSKQLAKRGHEVTIITTDFEFDEEYAKSIKREGAQVIPFHCTVNISLFLYSPSMKKWLKNNIKNFDVNHMHSFRSYQNSLVHYYANKHGVPYVLQAHGDIPKIGKQGLKKLYDWVSGYKILKDASKIIAVTKIEAEQYKKMGVDEDKIEIVPNGIDLSEYENLPKSGEFRRKYSIREDEKIILYLGRIHRTKGIDLLVKAFADISKELNNVKLVIVGPDDKYQSALEKLIQELKVDNMVLFMGFVSNEEKMAALVDADVFVNPRADEIFGLVFLEANACGTPVICSKGCGIANVIDGKTGFAVHNGKDQLRDAIIMVLSDEELGKRFGEVGRRLVREEFGWGKVVRKVEEAYEGCL